MENLETENTQGENMDSDSEPINEQINGNLDAHDKAKQARIMLVDRMKKIRVNKDIGKPRDKQSKKKKALKESHTGLTSHVSHTDLNTGYENAERGARQATLDSWVARPMKHVDQWKPD